MTPQELFEIDRQVNEVMDNITEDDSLCVIRDALTLFFSTQDLGGESCLTGATTK